jgi:hemerythrin superfamily protein
MDAIGILTRQHRETEELFSQLATSKGGVRVRLLGRLAELLTTHASLEEHHFYPLAREAGLGALVDRSVQDHADLRRTISDIMEMKQSDPKLKDVTDKLDRLFRAHVQQEEEQVFPQVREKVDEARLAAVGEEMESSSRKLEEHELLKMAEHEQTPAP